MRALAVWAVLFAAYAATLGVDAVGAQRLRGRRAALPAGRRVDRLRLRHRPHRRVRARAPTRTFHRGPLQPQGRVVLGAPARAAGHRLRAADRARLRDRRRHTAVELFLAAVGGARRSCSRAAGAADRARAVGDRARRCSSGSRRRRWRTRPRVYPEPAAGGDARRRGAVRAARARAARARQRGRRRGAARRAAVAGAEVPAAGGAGRGRRSCAGPRAAAAARPRSRPPR